MDVTEPSPIVLGAAVDDSSPGRQRAVSLARQTFMESRRIEMGQLAQELGVSRMTLNRWVGNRDRLLGDVNWTFAHHELKTAREGAQGTGANVVADTVEGFIAKVLDSTFHRAWLQQEGEIALRIATTRSSALQANFIAYVAQLIDDELPDRNLEMPTDDVAYLVVRIAESFCYVDMIAGGQPNAAKVGVAIRALLS